MSKRSAEDLSSDNNTTKRSKGPPTLAQLALEGAWIEEINSADPQRCIEIKSKLGELYKKTEQRMEELEQEETDRGLSYKGSDAISCDHERGCENTFQPGGGYGGTCDVCDDDSEQKCINCMTYCESCGTYSCDECNGTCSSCEDGFCRQCLGECDSCDKLFCGRDKSESGSGSCKILICGWNHDETLCKGCIY